MGEYNYSLLNPRVLNEHGRKVAAGKIVNLLRKDLKEHDLKKLKVLDLGCSSGIISAQLAEYFGEVIGIDIDQSAITKANRIKKENLKFYYQDVLNTKFDDNSFDVIIANQIYYYFKTPKTLTQEIYRVLKPGGLCLLSGGNKYSITKPKEPVKCYYKSFWELSKFFKRFEIKYQSKEIFRLRFALRIERFIPDFAWRILEPLTPNFVWILRKKI